jgi:hypothetical protein
MSAPGFEVPFTMDERDALDYAKERVRALLTAVYDLNNNKELYRCDAIRATVELALEQIQIIDDAFAAADARKKKAGEGADKKPPRRRRPELVSPPPRSTDRDPAAGLGPLDRAAMDLGYGKPKD